LMVAMGPEIPVLDESRLQVTPSMLPWRHTRVASDALGQRTTPAVLLGVPGGAEYRPTALNCKVEPGITTALGLVAVELGYRISTPTNWPWKSGLETPPPQPVSNTAPAVSNHAKRFILKFPCPGVVEAGTKIFDFPNIEAVYVTARRES